MHWFIVPNLDGHVTGGTLWNRMLLHTLHRRRIPFRTLPLPRAVAALANATAGDWYWLDSLYLRRTLLLAAALRTGTGLGLLLHYLPSLVEAGEPRAMTRWPADELAALRAVDALVVTSPFMAGLVDRLLDGSRPILVVEPGRLARHPAPLSGPPVRAVMVANLTPNKRVAELLVALRGWLRDSDDFQLRIVGGSTLDPEYAQRCHQLALGPFLRGRVELLGELSPVATVHEMAAGNLMLSASRMEAYGMALAEARTLGLPILATVGGHVERLVQREAGGELVGDPLQLAAACLALVRDADEHRRRLTAAREHAWPPRPWLQVADDWLRAMDTLGTVARPRSGAVPRGPVVRDGE